MKNLTATIFGTVPDEASFRWLSPEEFMALPRAEKDAYLYAVFAYVARKPGPEAGEQQNPVGQN